MGTPAAFLPVSPFRDSSVKGPHDLRRLIRGLRSWMGRHSDEAPVVCWVRMPADGGVTVIDFGVDQGGLDLLASHLYIRILGRLPTPKELRELGGTSASPPQIAADLFFSLTGQPAFRD